MGRISFRILCREDLLHLHICICISTDRKAYTDERNAAVPIMYVKEVFGKIILPLLVSLIFPYVLQQFFDPSVGRMLLISSTSVVWTGGCIAMFGLTKGERDFIFNKIKSFTLKSLDQ